MINALLYLLGALLLVFLLSLSSVGIRFRRWMMAKLYYQTQEQLDPLIAERKKRLFSEISGTVLEIGPGIGGNFAHLPDGVSRWIGLEPNPYMHEQLRAAAAQHGIGTDIREVGIENMDVEEESIGVVLSTHVLCSVSDPARAMRDIRRVLKPGGRFVFMEHVAAPRGTVLRCIQQVAKPLWWYLADGCRPDRELAQIIRAADFAEVKIDEFTIPKEVTIVVVSPHVAGVAVK